MYESVIYVSCKRGDGGYAGDNVETQPMPVTMIPSPEATPTRPESFGEDATTKRKKYQGVARIPPTLEYGGGGTRVETCDEVPEVAPAEDAMDSPQSEEPDMPERKETSAVSTEVPLQSKQKSNCAVYLKGRCEGYYFTSWTSYLMYPLKIYVIYLGCTLKKTVVPASSHQFCHIIPPEEVITRRDQLKSKASKRSAKGDGNEEGGKKRPSKAKAKAKAKSSRKPRSCKTKSSPSTKEENEVDPPATKRRRTSSSSAKSSPASVNDAPQFDERKVQKILEYVKSIDMGLEWDGLKDNVRQGLPDWEHASLNVYWSRSACGVQTVAKKGGPKDVAHFIFTKSPGPRSLKMVVAVCVGKLLVLWLLYCCIPILFLKFLFIIV